MALPNIDYGTYHLYPDGWNTSAAWGTQWIIDHIRGGKAIGKPVVLKEYGYKDPGYPRSGVYELAECGGTKRRRRGPVLDFDRNQ